MIDDFIFAFVTTLGEEGRLENSMISNKILEDIINSDEDFNHVALQYEEIEWILPLPNHCNRKPILKSINVKQY